MEYRLVLHMPSCIMSGLTHMTLNTSLSPSLCPRHCDPFTSCALHIAFGHLGLLPHYIQQTQRKLRIHQPSCYNKLLSHSMVDARTQPSGVVIFPRQPGFVETTTSNSNSTRQNLPQFKWRTMQTVMNDICHIIIPPTVDTIVSSRTVRPKTIVPCPCL